jgi:hypothetical protein
MAVKQADSPAIAPRAKTITTNGTMPARKETPVFAASLTEEAQNLVLRLERRRSDG